MLFARSQGKNDALTNYLYCAVRYDTLAWEGQGQGTALIEWEEK